MSALPVVADRDPDRDRLRLPARTLRARRPARHPRAARPPRLHRDPRDVRRDRDRDAARHARRRARVDRPRRDRHPPDRPRRAGARRRDLRRRLRARGALPGHGVRRRGERTPRWRGRGDRRSSSGRSSRRCSGRRSARAALRAPREGATLPGDLGWPAWTVVLAITVLGVAASMIARRVGARGTRASGGTCGASRPARSCWRSSSRIVDARPVAVAGRLGAMAGRSRAERTTWMRSSSRPGSRSGARACASSTCAMDWTARRT